jgi:repressor LexA
MYPTLTKKQKDILEYLKVYYQLHGYSPSLDEIKSQFRLSAISTVHEHIQNLKKKGYIYNEINQARSIRAIEPNLKEQELIEIPIVYSLKNNEILDLNKNQKTIQVSRALLLKDSKYMGMIVDTNEYTEIGILPKDILILKEAPDINFTAMILATVKNNKAMLLKTNSAGKIEKLVNDQILVKSICIKAIVCDLIRKYL